MPRVNRPRVRAWRCDQRGSAANRDTRAYQGSRQSHWRQQRIRRPTMAASPPPLAAVATRYSLLAVRYPLLAGGQRPPPLSPFSFLGRSSLGREAPAGPERPYSGGRPKSRASRPFRITFRRKTGCPIQTPGARDGLRSSALAFAMQRSSLSFRSPRRAAPPRPDPGTLARSPES